MLHHKNWEDNTSGCADVIALLELITMLEKNGKHINQGEIRIGFDCKKAYKKIVKSILKCNVCAQEAGGEIGMIKTSLNKIKCNVILQLVRGHENATANC